jgi:hypothetical protein
MLLSSQEPVVRQFLNARRQGPIGMAEEKDAAELEAEKADGDEMPALPPIPQQIMPTDGSTRPTQRPAGQWLKEHNITPPPGSFMGEAGYGVAPARKPAPRERVTAGGDGVRVLRSTSAKRAAAPAADAPRKRTSTAAKSTASKEAPAKKTTVRRSTGASSSGGRDSGSSGSRRRSS